MIRHLVLFKLNEGVERNDPRVVQGEAAFRALGGQIDELRFWELGWNISERPIAYDFAINSAVEDADALKRYLEHPAHQAGVALWREFATWVIAGRGGLSFRTGATRSMYGDGRSSSNHSLTCSSSTQGAKGRNPSRILILRLMISRISGWRGSPRMLR